jgi:uncharacterized protein DUF5715
MDKGHWKTVDWAGYGMAAFVLVGSTVAFFRPDLLRLEDAQAPETHVAPPPQVPGPAVNRWREAARRVEEDRGEPTGRAARVKVPPQLLHYADKRRFLAIQVAGWREEGYELPHDEAGLARLIRKGELVEVKPVTDDYVLYGVGANASADPMTHYDVRSEREITLYPRWDLFDDARAGKRDEVDARKAAIEAKRAELRKVTTKTRAGRRRRAAINKEIRAAQGGVAALQRRITSEAAAYDNYQKRRMLVEEWQVLQEQARDFGPRGYDLDLPGDRRAFRARLLSFIRPEALEVMLDIARQYREQFGRPLAFTSLVRSEHYQQELGETNANATQIAVPPHTTGLAFDIYYRYMTADEQHAIMGLIARLEAEGKLEALRENRDHYHLFAFAQGRRPDERLIAEALDDVRPVRLAQAGRAPVRKARSVVKGRTAARPAAARKSAAPKTAVPRASPPKRPR